MTTQEKIDKTWKHCIALYGRARCVALTLHGSQNYALNLPESDIDAKLFITPAWDEVVFCKQPMSKTIKGPYGDINVTAADEIAVAGTVNAGSTGSGNFPICTSTISSCCNSERRRQGCDKSASRRHH